ncbi:hypothetical protein LB465_03175 [Salegentibacter sp. LM13S]|uniref:hypothetical protein n=1 Tax=Salegentibacter lacus TaxID=2873599 RepID=UPI001CCD16BC|nr:hypothetical protein [Salegentibacter lacus]MBZ9629769.1 hypothetical protein [Salegentibacter lacus]
MRIASYNIENLYFRDESLFGTGHNKNFMDWLDEFEAILRKGLRLDDDYRRLRELSFLMGLNKENPQKYLVLRNHSGQLHGKIVTSGRSLEKALKGSLAWTKMTSQMIPQDAVLSKARVISEINPDVLLLQEIEDRASLLSFRDKYLADFNYRECYYFEGNSTKGLGFGILLRKGFSLSVCRAYSNKEDVDGKPLFGTGMQVLWLRDPKGQLFRIINTNLSSGEKGEKADHKRKAQLRFISQVWEDQLDMFHDLLICCGSLGRPSYCESLSELISKTEIRNILKSGCFKADRDYGKAATYFSLGAYQKGINLRETEYFLFNNTPKAEIMSCGLSRRGIWSGRDRKWFCYPGITSGKNQASSHPLMWADFLLKPD